MKQAIMGNQTSVGVGSLVGIRKVKGEEFLICPTCSAWTRVLETRHKYDNETYRRYECANGHRFSTMEKVKVERAANPPKAD